MRYSFFNMRRLRGLAPLEMVLAVPFLLLIMALIINVGNVACWKIRALTVARHSMWGDLSPRLIDHKTGNSDPRPDYWPAKNTNAGQSGFGDAANVAGVEAQYNARKPVVRGPTFQGLIVDTELLDPAHGVRSGGADITRKYPLVKSLGNFHSKAETDIFDDAWRCSEMRLPATSISNETPLPNDHFRLGILYKNFQPPGGNNPVLPIILAIYNSIFKQGELALLYGTEGDYLKFKLLYSVGVPMFIDAVRGWTRLNFGCSMDALTVKQAVEDLVERISGSKKQSGPLAAMSQGLIGYYQRVQKRIKELMAATPPPTPAQLAQMQKDLDTLDEYIKLLEQFISTL